MTTEEAKQAIASEINSLEGDFRDLHARVQLTSLRDQIEDFENSISNLPTRIQATRTRGYAFGKDYEDQAKDYAKRWRTTSGKISRKIESESTKLQSSQRLAQPKINALQTVRGNVSAARSRISSAKNAVEDLESKVSAAEGAIHGMYDSLQDDVYKMGRTLGKVEKALDELDEATFSLIATESVIMAVEAVMVEGSKEDKKDPKGILFLTDQRLLFEQKQEIATKKVLFVATEKEKVQKLYFETPVASVHEVKAEKKGFMKNEDHIELKLDIGTRNFHLDGQDCEDWATQIKRARDGEYDHDRALEIDEEVIEKVKDAPTICPQCGGQFSQPVLRGQDSITCGYCGHIERL
jgi:predicted  nucleic acid-binding Zn-ribbon protein